MSRIKIRGSLHLKVESIQSRALVTYLCRKQTGNLSSKTSLINSCRQLAVLNEAPGNEGYAFVKRTFSHMLISSEIQKITEEQHSWVYRFGGPAQQEYQGCHVHQVHCTVQGTFTISKQIWKLWLPLIYWRNPEFSFEIFIFWISSFASFLY